MAFMLLCGRVYGLDTAQERSLCREKMRRLDVESRDVQSDDGAWIGVYGADGTFGLRGLSEAGEALLLATKEDRHGL